MKAVDRLASTSLCAALLLCAVDSARPCDPEWTMIGDANDGVYAMTIYDDGFGPMLHVGGTFSMIDGVSANKVARWTGATWEALPDDDFLSTASVWAMESFNGELFVGGVNFPANFACNRVARFDGVLWDIIFGDCILNLTDTLQGTQGALYIGGTNFGLGPGGLVVWDLSSANALSTDGITGVEEFDGGVYASKTPPDGGGVWLVDEGGWIDIAAGSVAEDLTAWQNAMFASGTFTGFAGLAGANNIAGWDGSGWFRLGPGTDATILAASATESGIMNGLYVGGAFNFAGSVAASRIARWNGVSWQALGAGLPGNVGAIAATPSAVYAAVQSTGQVFVWACPGAPDDCDGDGIPDDQESDFDGDGIPDDCDSDSDGDGVPNTQDVCPFTPLGLAVDSDGRPRGDMNLDCAFDGLDIAPFVQALLP